MPRVLAVVVALLCWSACKDEPDASLEGQPCSSRDDCQGLACIGAGAQDPEDLAALPLQCAAPGPGHALGEACEASSDCALGVCLLSGACAQPCSTAAHCGRYERCDFAYARTATDALQTLHACVAMVDLPKDAVIDVETRKDALDVGRSNVALAADTAPTLFVLEHLDDPRWPFSNTECRAPLCAEKLVTGGASPQTLFELSAIGPGVQAPINPVANGAHVYPVTVLVPNGAPRGEGSSDYSLTVEATSGGDLRVTRLLRKSAGERLDLNVFYVGAAGFEVTGARGPALLADALDEVDAIFAQADLYIGEVRQIEVTGALLEKGTKIDGVDVGTSFSTLSSHFGVWPQLPKLFELSAGASNVALDIFFVADVEMQPGLVGDVGAVAGGTPGPLGMHGTSSSGIVVSTDMMVGAGAAKQLGRTLAHEIGHMLGLFHTTETDGSVLDPLEDTPTCPLSADLGGDGLDATDCADAGGDNLMFPTNATGAVTLTEDQRAVLRAALILQ